MSDPKLKALKALKDFVVDTRLAKRLSQRDLAHLSGIPVGTIAALEGETSWRMPRQPTLEKLAKGLGVPYLVLDRITRGLPPEPDHKTTGLSNLLQDAPDELKQTLLEYSVWPEHLRRAFELAVRGVAEGLRQSQRP